MFKPGFYKIAKVFAMGEEGRYYETIEEHIKRIDENCEDPEEAEHEKKELSMGMIVSEDGKILTTMDIPEGVSEEEIQKAIEEQGVKIVDGKVIVEESQGKVQDGELYLHDESKFLTGEEWVKISTDVPDEINLITFIYKLVE